MSTETIIEALEKCKKALEEANVPVEDREDFLILPYQGRYIKVTLSEINKFWEEVINEYES